MADNRILTFYSHPKGHFDLIAGLQAWMEHGGKCEFGGVSVLERFDSETHVEPVSREYRTFDLAEIETLREITDEFDVMLTLVASWFTPSIQVASVSLQLIFAIDILTSSKGQENSDGIC